MLSQPTYALVTCLISLCSAIRVDFNTNKGPIVPPTPRTTVRPLQPYREPAAVWEDQSNDIPNPNPYTYILPPPSRPRTTGNNFANLGQRPLHYHGNLLLPSDVNVQGNTNSGGGSLAAKYIPNVGIRYTAVVAPSSNNNQVNLNNGGNNYFGIDNKLHGKYNEKTKKYKAYEKVKYVPQRYYPLLELTPPIDKPYTSVFNQDQLIRTQQLPHLDAPPAFRPFNNEAAKVTGERLATPAAETTIATTNLITSSNAGQTKLAHEKDQVLTKSKSSLAKIPLKLPNALPTPPVGHSANATVAAKSR
ncbi:uncharacterized protein LOC128859936 [Anastrepha ludens]|uniref:uncharacterized protein LOC128859936 n=1 Tax=Anastrepha ludens TaxID=28586 RepID=UPI0023B06139|nr:uncharacterized protein LOC128859936 [Anastrepha ludens]XP_053953070.1 uncharacterized protein LOC128859936 [Anastrepha ludens]XP_053953071.1 uncharacterized protein LOC128859936 [Anastrepha ludens]XP_053953072.1 uncharacterized protein LOC128859936 [Anastrepha ludens]XP_053953073.1 uncharacterized protein LOC128859936 [Anastrepha ludens]XP_053953074.1 uncharacterized protein LOC128859936 [Anastrepha ludens]XP_053953075.1 uncharacterized protein LOC128859936 [Anastrepha ludens]XP_05395307